MGISDIIHPQLCRIITKSIRLSGKPRVIIKGQIINRYVCFSAFRGDLPKILLGKL